MSLNTIILKGLGHHDEGLADATIYPGEAVRLAADGHYDPETLSGELAPGRGLKIAKENALGGKTVDQAWAADDTLQFYTPLPGDHVQVLVKTGETIAVGDNLSVEGSGSGKFIKVASSASTSYPIRLTDALVHDALASRVPGTAANDDMGLVTGVPGTAAPTLVGVDFGGTSTDEKCAFLFTLPQSYRAGSAVSILVHAGASTTVSDGTLTLDCEVWKDQLDGTVGSDLCATAAQSINSLTLATKTFTVTPTGLEAGDTLIIRLSFGGSDTGNLGVMNGLITAVGVTIGDTVGGQLEALESSGGVLAAAALIKCRVL